MVRGLVIRQLFLFADVVLIGLIVFTVGMVLVRVVNTPKVTLAANQVASASPSDDESLIGELGDRMAYTIIQKNGLFGNAGRLKMTAPAPEPVPIPLPVDESLEETALNLKLWGTTSLSPTSPYATASIEDASKRARQLYTIGDDVVDNVTLEEIHQRWVILLNRRESPPRRERLSMDDEEEGEQLASRSVSNSSSARPTVLPSERVELNKTDFVRELYENYADLVTKVKPEVYRDANGNVVGVTAPDIGDIPLAKQLGLAEGDVLQTVNNEQIDSEQKVMEMVQKYQNSNSFRIGIMRNGKQKIITYNFR